MGTYPTLPSHVLETDEDLQEVLDKHSQELIGENVIKKFGHTKLPYLPKVLSISKALPLQLHPVCLLVQKGCALADNLAEQRPRREAPRERSRPVHRLKPQARDCARPRPIRSLCWLQAA